MHICMITSAPFPPREGIGFYVWNLSRYLTDQGHQVQIITRGRAGRTSREVVDNITIWRPAFLPTYPFHVHLHSMFVDNLVRELESEVDLFHLHTPLVKWPGTRSPAIVTVHTPMKTDTGAIPVTNLLSWLIKLQAPVSYLLEQRLFQRADKLVAVAQSVAQELRLYGVDPRQISVLGNGVDTTIFSPYQRPDASAEPYVLTAGRLAPRKGLEDLIRCAELVVRQIPNMRFLIAGAGPLEEALRVEIARRKLETQVTLLGHIADRADMLRLYQGAAAYVHAAHYEGLPTVLLEAMACGRPVIATAVSGALDVVQDERNGLLVPPRNPKRMAGSIIRLLQDPGLGERLGMAAYETIQKHYSWHVVSRSYLAQYEALLAGVPV
jgi:glycosyltransferase involved in cell wall biosynthesis